MASIYTPVITDLNPLSVDATLHEGGAMALSSALVVRKTIHTNGRYFPRTLQDITIADEHDFAHAHVRWCHAGLKVSTLWGDEMVQQA